MRRMSWHLFGICVTAPGVAANNRGETEGHITTLQKLLWNGEVHTTVSAEAIRWAIRYQWQQRGFPVNRSWDEAAAQHRWQDPTFASWGADSAEVPIDDDVLGFMSARSGAEEGNPAEATASTGRGRRPRGRVSKRRAPLEIARAVSLTPYAGDITFNAAGVGATPSASRTGQDPVPYGTEVHATRYQYGFALTPEALRVPTRAKQVVDAVVELPEVAGNHARFLFDFSPEVVVFRWTQDFAPRMLYGFSPCPDGGVSLETVLRRVRQGDILPQELTIGGLLEGPDAKDFRALQVDVHAGVKQAAHALLRRMADAMKWPDEGGSHA